jgi:hypothetical protein
MVGCGIVYLKRKIELIILVIMSRYNDLNVITLMSFSEIIFFF